MTRQACPQLRPRAQIAFKNLMIHRILKFTLSISFHYVLHHNKSQDIHFRESFPCITEKSATKLNRGGPPHNKCKAKGQKEEKAKIMKEREKKVSNPLIGRGSNREQSPPSPTPSQKGGKCMGQQSRRTRVATPGARAAFSPSPTPAHNNSPFSP
jgi:hypothetical protein